MRRIVTACLAFIVMTAAHGLHAQTWRKLSTNTPSGFKGITFIDAQRGYAVGDLGAIYATTNGGDSWKDLSLETFTGFWGVHAAAGTSGDIVYIAGDNGTAMKSTDGGKSWETQDAKYSEGFTFGLAGKGSMNCWITGGEGPFGASKGVIVRTTDGGDTWVKSAIEGTYSFDKSFFVDATTGYAAGTADKDFDRGVIYKTTNGGAAWSKVLEADGGFNSVYCFDADRCVAVGFDGAAMRTNDGGVTWSPLALPSQFSTSTFTHVAFVDEMLGFITEVTGAMLKTTDGGATWSRDNTYNGGGVIWSLDVVRGEQESAVFAAGDGGRIYKLAILHEKPAAELSTSEMDFGKLVVGDSLEYMVIVSARNSATVMIDSIHIEHDEGESGFSIVSPSGPYPLAVTQDMPLQIMVKFKPSVVTAPVSADLVIETNDPQNPAFTVTLLGEGTEPPASVDERDGAARISAEVLPNPMSASGSIAVTLASSANLKVALHDIEGNSLGTLFNAHAEAGEHGIAIPAESLPNGVYYCVVDAGGKVMVREIRIVR